MHAPWLPIAKPSAWKSTWQTTSSRSSSKSVAALPALPSLPALLLLQCLHTAPDFLASRNLDNLQASNLLGAKLPSRLHPPDGISDPTHVPTSGARPGKALAAFCADLCCSAESTTSSCLRLLLECLARTADHSGRGSQRGFATHTGLCRTR